MRQFPNVRIPRGAARLALALLLAGALAAGASALSLGDVTFNDHDDLVDASSIKAALNQGISLFHGQYPELARRNASWLAEAELSAGGSHAVDDGEDSYYFRLDLAHGEDEDSFRFDIDPHGITARDFSQALRNLVLAIEGFGRWTVAPPALVRRFSIDAFQAEMPAGSVSAATGIAVLPDGRLVIGHGLWSSVVDPMLRLQGEVGRELARSGQYAAANLRASPSGTVLASLADSTDLVAFNPPSTEARTISTGLGSLESLAWLTDGTLVVKEGRVPRVFAIEAERRYPITLAEFTGPRETAILAAGPDATLFSFNPLRKYLSWYDKSGRLLGRTIPALAENQFGQVRAMAWLPDGNFLLRGSNFLTRLTITGELVWNLALDPALGNQIGDAAWSEKEQSVYLLLPGSRTVLQYQDAKARYGQSAAGSANPDSQTLLPDYRLLAKLDEAIRKNPGDAASLQAQADYYSLAGAADYALSLYQNLLRQTSGNTKLTKLVAELKSRQLLAGAQSIDARARITIRDIGPQTAQADYAAAMSRYEQAQALKPGDAAIIQARASLAKAMRDATEGLTAPVVPLSLEEGELEPVFPALLASYRRHPVATVTLRNATGFRAENVRVSLFLPRFMDFPTAAPLIAVLEAGEEIRVPLVANFNQEALALEEDVPVQARVRVEWTSKGEPANLERGVGGLVYRRTALTWDDAGKLAAFITPNENTVNRLAMSLVDSANQAGGPAGGPRLAEFSGRLERASAIIDGLAAYRMQYLEDPLSPLSQVMGLTMAVDTVRFPRTSLLFHNGDCDDLTALLASLLESVGIPTAILTSPGHVFLAFDSGLAADKAWILEGAAPAVSWQGSLWVPLESTILTKGLAGSWAEAAREVARWKGNADFAFMPVAALRASYPPVPLPPSPITLDLPDAADLRRTLKASETGLLDLLYRGNLKLLGQAKPDPADEAQRLNRIGVLGATFGDRLAATVAFTAALRAKPDFFAATLNLANLCLLDGQIEKAAGWLNQARLLRPDAPSIPALAQRLAQARGEAGAAGNLALNGAEPAPSGPNLRAGDAATNKVQWLER